MKEASDDELMQHTGAHITRTAINIVKTACSLLTYPSKEQNTQVECFIYIPFLPIFYLPRLSFLSIQSFMQLSSWWSSSMNLNRHVRQIGAMIARLYLQALLLQINVADKCNTARVKQEGST